MTFLGVKWGSMGSMWYAEVQCGSQVLINSTFLSHREKEILL